MAEEISTEPLPLAGIKIIELGIWVAGPAASGILADWGAEVIKIETPAGDPARSFGQMLGGDLPINPPFELDNRAKRSMVLDLNSKAGMDIALELIDSSDVFMTNLRKSAVEDLGLTYEKLSKRNPKLVYCAITGYGTKGPDADRPAYDIAAYWARSGIASMLTPPGANPPFQRGGMGDHTVGLAGASAITAGLLHRERTGKGRFVSTSLFRSGMYTISFDLNVRLLWGLTMNVGTREAMGNPAINNYTAKDEKRFWIVGLEGSRHWPPLAKVVGHPEWLEDEKFATPQARAQNAQELIAALDEIFAQKTMAEWEKEFAKEPDFFWAPMNTIDQLIEDPQFEPAGAMVSVPTDSGSVQMAATPVDFDGVPPTPRGLAPELGEHTLEILTEAGKSKKDIEELKKAGAFGKFLD